MSSNLKERIEQELKTALLARDTLTVMTLRSVKSAILNEEVAKQARDRGLNDEEISQLLVKESKKRQESADLYEQGNNSERRDAELAEKAIIDAYLPDQLSESELKAIVSEVVQTNSLQGMPAMGQAIGLVKQKVGASADGAIIARLVREELEAT